VGSYDERISNGGKHWPFASADSTNVTLHYAEQQVTAEYMARQIDGNQCPINWKLKPTQKELLDA